MPTAPDHEAARREALGRVIAMRRAELGLKRNDLRDRSNLSYPYLAELENGTKRPSQGALAAIAEALELRPSELLERAEVLLGGSDLMRSAPSRQPTWFHSSSTPMVAAAMSAPAPQASRAVEPPEHDLRSIIEEIVRDVVRDELRRAGIEPGAPTPGRQPR